MVGKLGSRSAGVRVGPGARGQLVLGEALAALFVGGAFLRGGVFFGEGAVVGEWLIVRPRGLCVGIGGGPLAQSYPRTWSLANWGQNLLANPRGRGLYVWQNNVGAKATLISQAPQNINSMMVNNQRQVMAFGCNEVISGAYNPMCIRASDYEDYSVWTPATSNNSFEYTLQGGGRIVGHAHLGTQILIWTDTSLFLATYQGAAEALWRFDKVSDNCGLAGPNAFTIVNQTAYWLTPDLQFYVYMTGTRPAAMACTVSTDFKTNIDPDHLDKVVCASIAEFGEIWWHYPDVRDTPGGAKSENSRYVAVSTQGGAAWFLGDVARTAAIDSGSQRYPVKVDPGSTAYFHENGQTANGAALPWSLTVGDQYLSEAELRMMLRTIWPDFKDQVGDILMTIYTKDYPQAPQRTKGPYTLAEGRRKRDLTVEGRIFSMRFDGVANGDFECFARMGKLSADVVQTTGA